jgi:hypothetical protein
MALAVIWILICLVVEELLHYSININKVMRILGDWMLSLSTSTLCTNLRSTPRKH